MPSPAQLIRKLAGSSAVRHGWIGVDVGTDSAALAQVSRKGLYWSLEARWTLENVAEAAPSPATTEPGALEGDSPASADAGTWLAAHRDELRRARGIMQGKNTAVCLSSSSVVFRTLEIPDASDEDRAAMIRQELTADDESDAASLEFDSWPVDADASGPRRDQWVTAAITGEISDRVAESLLQAGYHPRVLDAAPYAMARAIHLCDPHAEAPTIALKIDVDSALFVLIRNGRPGFCRVLRGCGFRSLSRPLVAKLGMNARECRQVLLRHGIPAEVAAGGSTADSFYRLLANPFEKLVDEVKRTCAFIDRGKAGDRPERMWLFGDGAAVRNLPALLSTRSGVPTVGWSPSFPVAGPVDDCRFGVAAGLSALAWEV